MDNVDGFVPTVTDHSNEGGQLVLHTLDGRRETDILVTEDGPVRRAQALTDEQQEKLELRE